MYRDSWSKTVLDSGFQTVDFWIPDSNCQQNSDFLLVERGFRILKPKVVYLSQKLLENPVGKWMKHDF